MCDTIQMATVIRYLITTKWKEGKIVYSVLGEIKGKQGELNGGGINEGIQGVKTNTILKESQYGRLLLENFSKTYKYMKGLYLTK